MTQSAGPVPPVINNVGSFSNDNKQLAIFMALVITTKPSFCQLRDQGFCGSATVNNDAVMIFNQPAAALAMAVLRPSLASLLLAVISFAEMAP